MKLTPRILISALLLAWLAILLAPLALFAQAAPKCAPGLTCGSACGAPGTGVIPSTRTPTNPGVELTRNPGVPGLRVDADGGWTTCQPPDPTAGCEVEQVLEWTAGEHTCRVQHDYTWLSHDTRRSVATSPAVGALQGYATLQCLAGRSQIVASACAPRTRCDAPPPGYTGRSDDPGQPERVFRWTGSLPVGGQATARAGDGQERQVACDLAGLRLLPAVAPVQPPATPKPVTCGPAVMMSGTSVVYRYGGPPVAPEQRRDFESAAGQKRSMLCGPNGHWLP